MLAPLLLLACAPKAPPVLVPVTPESPEALLAQALGEAPPAALAAPFGVQLTTSTDRVSASGTLLYGGPDRFRVELRGPIGGPALILVSDGAGLTAWQAGPNRLLTAADADARLGAATNGAVGLETLAAVLIGRMPALGAPSASRVVEGGAIYDWTTPDGARAEAEVDGRTARPVRVEVLGPKGDAWLAASLVPGAVGALGPDAIAVTLPTLGASAEVDYGDWAVAAPPDAAFRLPTPAGAEIVPLELP
jgi:hypothetical protein